jgi:hypothetical protein
MFGTVNYLALGVTALIHFAFGAVWFGMIFGKQWQKLMNIDEEKMTIMKGRQALSFILSIIGSVLLSYAAARLISVVNPESLLQVILLSILCWSGFSLIKCLQDYAYEGQPIGLTVMNTAYYAIGFTLVFIILYYWR